jgi:two-component system KDP operon response regulator KdpE
MKLLDYTKANSVHSKRRITPFSTKARNAQESSRVTQRMKHLLIVDDNNDYRDALIKALKRQGHRTTSLKNPDSLGSVIAIHRPDVLLMEMTFEDGTNALEVCRQVRTWSSLPIIIMSLLDDEDTKVKVLDAGADDYLIKPIGINELMARIRTIERRMTNQDFQSAPILTIGDLSIDLEKRLVKLADQPIRLTRKEYALIKTLASAEGGLVTYDKIIDSVWPDELELDRRRVRALVMYVRGKLREDLSNPKYILTEAGIGYRLNM